MNGISAAENFILALLRACCMGGDLPDAPEDTDWEEIYTLAKRHAVISFVFDCLNKNKEKYHVAPQAEQKLRRGAAFLIAQNAKLMYRQNEATKLFEREGIDCAVMKGASVSVCYPNPELRPLGDIDILFRPDECLKATELLCENGYTRKNIEGNSLHECVEDGEVRIEPHYRPSCAPNKKYDDIITQLFSDFAENTRRAEIPPYSFTVLSVKHQALQLIMHMERHFVNSGIGLRQLLDWAVFVKAEVNPRIWSGEIAPALRECGLYRFAQAVTGVCVRFLGLEPSATGEENPEEQLYTELLSSVLRSGNMGRGSEDSFAVKTLAAKGSALSGQKGVPKGIRGVVVLRTRQMFPVCDKHPVLLVLFCPVYAARYAFFTVLGKRKFIFSSEVNAKIKRQKNLYAELKIFEPDGGDI